MDEQVKAKIIEWLQAMEAGVKSEIPAYCGEVVNWHIAGNIVNGVGYLIVGIILLATIRRLYNWFIRDVDENCPYDLVAFAGFVYTIVMVLTVVAFGSSVWCCTSNAVKGVVAPRAVIIEHLRGAVGSRISEK